MLTKQMTRYTKEKHADSLMKIATSIFTALLITIFIAPLVAILKNPGNGDSSFLLNSLKGPNGILFMALEFTTIAIAMWAKVNALKIYNELHPDKD